MMHARPARALFVPSKAFVIGVFGLAVLMLALRVAGIETDIVRMLSAIVLAALVAVVLWDGWISSRRWRDSAVIFRRKLPSALALNVRRELEVTLDNPSPYHWHVRCFDQVDPTLAFAGLPMALRLAPGKAISHRYSITPTQRGEVSFAPAVLRVRSYLGLLELQRGVGTTQRVRVFPNFAEVARYAWLAGNRRLTEIGIKAFQKRGEGTDFKELTEYRVGDPIRHIDWKATLKHNKPIVREFQDERDQCVLFMLDCGRRMRAQEEADDAPAQVSHFDQALNALMLLSYVALKQGDAVGAMTFGTETAQQRLFAPRKGIVSFNALMAALYAVQPQPAYSDYMIAARDLMRRHTKRSLIVILTNFRDEDAAELGPALALLRTRHLVMLASLREQVVRQIQEQPLRDARATLEVASAHLYAQSRDDAFRRLAARDTLLMDVEPDHLAVELVNRYHAVKRAGRL